MFGPSIDVPIFEGGRLRGTLRLRRSQQREAAINYKSTVLRAWQDADNALTTYAEDRRQRANVAEAVQQNVVALAAARQRYQQGAVDFLNVLAAQSALLQKPEHARAGRHTNRQRPGVALSRAGRRLAGRGREPSGRDSLRLRQGALPLDPTRGCSLWTPCP